VTIHYKIPTEELFVLGDSTRLRQILINLIGNAIKFTEKGSVTIRVASIADVPNGVSISVVDTGIGIAQDKIQHIFESFTQESSDTTRKFGGTGLGLAISKQLIELMHGELVVESTQGKGSSFIMKLPLVATNELATETKDKVSSSVEIRKGLRILLAEDNQFNQMVAEDTLRMVIPDLTLDIVDNGVQAIEKLTSGNYDLVILDIHMPEMDGYETTQFIRTQMPSPLNGVPIMAMTANVISEEIDKCFAVGMNAYVSKPFTHEDLFDKIKSLTSK